MKNCCSRGTEISRLTMSTRSCRSSATTSSSTSAGHTSSRGDYRGHEGALTLLENIAKGSEQTYTQDIHDILANDTHGVVLLRGSGRRSGGQSLDALEVHTWHVAGGN